MRNIKFFLLGFLTISFLLSCDKDKNDSEECMGTTVSTTDSGYDIQVKSTIEYYNSSGFLRKVETNFFDSKNDYYETYKYDSENKIIEYFRSYEGYSKYYYDAGNKIKTEFYDLDMNLTGYFTFTYSNGVIIEKNKYIANGDLDTTINYYYNNGFLDSIVTIFSTLVTSHYDKMEYKYDNNGNNIEKAIYSNYEKTNIELISRDIYLYYGNILIKYKPQDSQGNLRFGIYYKYNYDELGNLIKTEIFDSNDNLVDSLIKDYKFCDKIKLIKPDL